MKVYTLNKYHEYMRIENEKNENRELIEKISFFNKDIVLLKNTWGKKYFEFVCDEDKIGKRWVKVSTKRNPDFTGISALNSVFSQNVINLFTEDILLKYGELLPIETNMDKEYYIFNITNKINDSVDIENCKQIIIDYSKYNLVTNWAFYKEKLENELIFRVDYSNITLVTSNFVEKVVNSDLVGYRFECVWSEDGILDEDISK